MKQNKIIACVSNNDMQRNKLMLRTLVSNGFALTQHDANKLIKKSVYDIDLLGAYYVCADGFNFRDSPITTQRLYELAARGIFVMVGVKRLPREYEFICEAIFE